MRCHVQHDLRHSSLLDAGVGGGGGHLYREVHLLAYHYHWSATEILRMSTEKRRKFLRIVGGRTEGRNGTVSRFLVNLARRGAGFPMTSIQAPPPSPFGPEIRQHRDQSLEGDGTAPVFRIAEEPSMGNTASPSPSATRSFEGYRELPEAPIHHAVSIQLLSLAESSPSANPWTGRRQPLPTCHGVNPYPCHGNVCV